MGVSFEKIIVDGTYSRHELAALWGYASMHALARGVVTPRDDNKILLFVTEIKKTHSTQYKDHLSGRTLYWEGPNDHFAENRMLNASQSGDQIHLFYRHHHGQGFTYMGPVIVVHHVAKAQSPSNFVLEI